MSMEFHPDLLSRLKAAQGMRAQAPAEQPGRSHHA